MPAWRVKAWATVMRSAGTKGSALRPRNFSAVVSAALAAVREESEAIVHHRLIGLLGAVPFDHDEFGGVQRALLAVPKDAGEIDDPPLAGGEQLLHGEFRRGVEVALEPGAAGRHQLGGEGVEMGLVARRDLQRRGLDLEEAVRVEIAAERANDRHPRQQEGPAVGMARALPEGSGGGFRAVGAHDRAGSFRQSRICARRAGAFADFTPCSRVRGAGFAPEANSRGSIPLKVIASQLRKGNVVEVDGQLYAVLSAENFHPGKGTPTTQIDMRRISDGVKVSQRYKTTEQVERAFVEDHDYQYLFKDGDGFTFMSSETYDQVHVPKDIVGDYAPYLQENMTVRLSLHEGVPISIELPQRVTLEVVETEPTDEGPDRVVLLQAGAPLERRPHAGAGAHRAGDADHRHDRGRVLRRAGEGLSPP